MSCLDITKQNKTKHTPVIVAANSCSPYTTLTVHSESSKRYSLKHHSIPELCPYPLSRAKDLTPSIRTSQANGWLLNYYVLSNTRLDYTLPIIRYHVQAATRNQHKNPTTLLNNQSTAEPPTNLPTSRIRKRRKQPQINGITGATAQLQAISNVATAPLIVAATAQPKHSRELINPFISPRRSRNQQTILLEKNIYSRTG